MNCPKCQGAMDPVTVETVTVDRCTRCAGLWLDGGELQALMAIRGAEKVDSGDEKVGQLMDKVPAEMTCPRCSKPLVSKVDIDQHHIHYESCAACKGMFLDAGEFKDLKSYTFGDYIRGLFKHKEKKA